MAGSGDNISILLSERKRKLLDCHYFALRVRTDGMSGQQLHHAQKARQILDKLSDDDVRALTAASRAGQLLDMLEELQRRLPAPSDSGS